VNYIDSTMVPLKARSDEEVEQALGLLLQLQDQGTDREPEVRLQVEARVATGALDQALALGLVATEQGRVRLTAAGESIGREVTRRHLLAERLLADILDIRGDDLDANACQWEHILSPEVTRSICTLLGHPRTCPHGRAIPQGECCRGSDQDLAPLLTPLAKLALGAEARVAYLSLAEASLLHRLLSLGLVPGTRVRLRQNSPACIVQVGENLVALEKELAEAVVVRRT
jgi:DtxR family Mn-dependent transcriptional regulator